ncbi:hypothetical protein [Phycicoccus flavus]|uniref:hypothetical protein n=1 Tax=Phycicoccus flavus TaxID=2502783 RepID=UPI000FF0CCF4|nr:hypothetical protein [Phycicoccus flavus]NHA67288.1 hypothetical protein [Phycicoccus flavus]
MPIGGSGGPGTAHDQEERMTEPAGLSTVWRCVAGAAALAVAGAMLVAFWSVKICDGELANTGDVVSVCRHLSVTDPPVVIGGVAVVLLLAVALPVSELSAFGVSLKREVLAAKQTADEARELAHGAETVSVEGRRVADRAADTAIEARAAANSADRSAGLAERLALSRAREGVDEAAEHVDDLVDEYRRIRSSEPSSSERTAKLEALVGQMIGRFTNAHVDDFDPRRALSSPNEGSRVAAYAWAYAHPDVSDVDAIIRAAVAEPQNHRFGQYWGFRAVRRALAERPGTLSVEGRRLLEAWKREHLAAGSDREVTSGRSFEVSRALAFG